MWIFWLSLFAGFLILVSSADRFVCGTAAIARNIGVSPLIIGLTIVGFGTSTPEILVSSVAAWEGNTGLAVGNAVGSNIANIGLILGCTALLAPVTVHSQTLRREMPILLVTSVASYLLCLRGGLDRFDGVVLIVALFLFLFWLVQSALRNRHKDPFEFEVDREIPRDLSTAKACLWTSVGLAGLLVSSKLLVWAAVKLSQAFGISDLVIGLTVIALGTSLPELAASVTSILKKEDDIAIGNVVGSNMYNLLAVLPMPGIIAPGPLEAPVLVRDFPWMIGFTVALFLTGFSLRSHGKITRIEGILLLLAYCGYQFSIYRATL
ncbi:MAG: calcium/sodium antiporter [Gammaproteobacteria bacterium]